MKTEAVPEVHVVVAHRARATLRVGDVFLKVDPDRAGIDAEVAAMALVPVPTPEILWRNHPVLAIGLVPGTALGKYGHRSPVGPGSWTAAGAAVRALHDTTPLPSWGGRSVDELVERLDEACAWILTNEAVTVDVLEHNRRLARLVLRPHTPVFAHGDLQPDHIFVVDDRVTGIIDWSSAGPGDPLHDLAVLTLGHPEHLDDVLAGYGEADLELIQGWWSYRALTAIPWLVEHGFGPVETYPETAVLLAAMH
ncbi:phosphotransferase family protein [Cellulomonas sp. URHB0016]